MGKYEGYEIDTKFKKEFRKLKQLRNSHQIDEPEFDELVEQLSAEHYAHKTEDGWCCACEADMAFMYSTLQAEGWTPPKDWSANDGLSKASPKSELKKGFK